VGIGVLPGDEALFVTAATVLGRRGGAKQ